MRTPRKADKTHQPFDLTMIKKILLALVIIIPASWIGLTIYVMATDDLEGLMICSTSDTAYRIPKSVCEYYMLHLRGTKEDLAKLEQRAGLSFVFSDPQKRAKFLHFLVEKGINVNKVSPMTGYAPLHIAVASNEPELVTFLLAHGADPTIKTKNNRVPEHDNLTALELVEGMSRSKPEIDRSKVKQILEAHSKKITAAPK